MKPAFTITLFNICIATAIAQSGAADVTPEVCSELNKAVIAQAATGHLAEAKALLPHAAGSGDACTGVVLGNMARMMAVLGRTAEAERLAEESTAILERLYPQDNWMLLRPLQILAFVRLEAGHTAKAREDFRRIQSIRPEHPEDRAIVHGTLGVLLQMEGRFSEAEGEYQDSLSAWEEAGRGESGDAAAILHCLGTLYLKERRLDDTRRVLDRAFLIHDRSKDTVPMDRLKSLHLRGVLHARLREWTQSEQDFRDALSLADREFYVDPEFLRLMLSSYSYVLRKNHHGREARVIDARKNSLPRNGTVGVVDVSDLLPSRKAPKKESNRY
jgi:tetratricopeptide (TPR) repeat protein